MSAIDRIKQYQYKPTKVMPEDREVMKDMIQSGTSLNAFIEFWTKEVGITYRTAGQYYSEIKKELRIAD